MSGKRQAPRRSGRTATGPEGPVPRRALRELLAVVHRGDALVQPLHHHAFEVSRERTFRRELL